MAEIALGIYRERRFSPGKEDDDRAILDAAFAEAATLAQARGDLLGQSLACRVITWQKGH